jgi:hypothetical protein
VASASAPAPGGAAGMSSGAGTNTRWGVALGGAGSTTGGVPIGGDGDPARRMLEATSSTTGLDTGRPRSFWQVCSWRAKASMRLGRSSGSDRSAPCRTSSSCREASMRSSGGTSSWRMRTSSAAVVSSSPRW